MKRNTWNKTLDIPQVNMTHEEYKKAVKNSRFRGSRLFSGVTSEAKEETEEEI